MGLGGSVGKRFCGSGGSSHIQNKFDLFVCLFGINVVVVTIYSGSMVL